MIVTIWSITARRWRWIGAAALVVLATSGLLWCGQGEPTPLPRAVVRQLERHAVATAADTADIHRLERSAISAHAKQDAASAHALRTKSVADRKSEAADSAARVAVEVEARAAARAAAVRDSAVRDSAVSDSAAAWQRTYEAEWAYAQGLIAVIAQQDSALATLSVVIAHEDSALAALKVVIAQQDTALAFAELRAASIDSALARSEARAARADSALSAVVILAESRTAPCRIVRLLTCPSRTAVMIGAAVVTAALVKWPTASR